MGALGGRSPPSIFTGKIFSIPWTPPANGWSMVIEKAMVINGTARLVVNVGLGWGVLGGRAPPRMENILPVKMLGGPRGS